MAWLSLFVLMSLGAWARWRVMQAGIFQVDEYISMLAIKMILEKGEPLLPSGLYYDHGLVFSYLGAIFAALANGNLLAARWWALSASVLSVAVAYLVCWRLFRSPGWGLLAAAGFALYSDAILWGTRVRMYSQANLLLLLWILLFWLGGPGGGRRWARLALGIAVWIGVYTHSVLLLALPPLVVAAIVVWLVRQGGKVRWPTLSPALVLEGLFVITIIVLTIWMSQRGFVASYTIDTSVPSSGATAITTDPMGEVIDFAISGLRWSELGSYLAGEELLPFSVLALLGVVILSVNLARGQRRYSDLAALFIALMLGSMMLGMLLFVADRWHEGRYRFLVIFPPLLLLAAYGLQAVFKEVVWLTQKVWPGNRWGSLTVGLVTIFLLGAVWPMAGLLTELPQVILAETDTPNQYNLAFEYVETIRTPEDQIITVRPAAGYIFSTAFSYYINDASPVLIPQADGYVDGYTGTPYLNSVEMLNELFAEPGRLWFVVDEKRVFGSLEPIFTQYILWRTEVAQEIGNILILRETNPPELPFETATHPLNITFANQVQLSGYTIDKQALPEKALRLTTFWQNTKFMWVYKVFVHLQDQDGNITAQADFDPLEQIDPKLRNRMISQAGEAMIPLRTTLSIPSDLPAGTYTLYIGLYNRETLERVPVSGDTSGENAIFLKNLDLGGFS
jgi:4-amino-4-deoxy-L-arabinose transferase-like glycosyltransferase